MKKIGLISLAIVLALGGLGIGFAHWSQNLFIDGTVETGKLCVGFVDQLTDDNGRVENELKDPDDDGDDPLAVDGCPEVCTKCPNIGKKVASTTCALSIEKGTHKDPETGEVEICHEKLTITIDKAYPQYNPTVWFDIANCGSIPVNIVGAWIIDGPAGVTRADSSTWIELPKCKMIQVDLDGLKDPVSGLLDEDVGIGFSAPLDAAGDPIEPQQIDPCETKQYDLHFCFKQGLNQDTKYDFEIKIHALQWNETFTFPPPLE